MHFVTTQDEESAILNGMDEASHVTQILHSIEQGDPSAAERLLPLVYDELKRLAARRIANEKPGLTPQPTALVHEAYLRLVDVEQRQKWISSGHFFSAAAEGNAANSREKRSTQSESKARRRVAAVRVRRGGLGPIVHYIRRGKTTVSPDCIRLVQTQTASRYC
jgi:hypothetical protein